MNDRERGMMRTKVRGEMVDIIPFVGVLPKHTAKAMTQLLDYPVYYEPHKPGGGDGVA